MADIAGGAGVGAVRALEAQGVGALHALVALQGVPQKAALADAGVRRIAGLAGRSAGLAGTSVDVEAVKAVQTAGGIALRAVAGTFHDLASDEKSPRGPSRKGSAGGTVGREEIPREAFRAGGAAGAGLAAVQAGRAFIGGVEVVADFAGSAGS